MDTTKLIACVNYNIIAQTNDAEHKYELLNEIKSSKLSFCRP